MTTINYCGSRTLGAAPATIDELCEVLKSYVLERWLEPFISRSPDGYTRFLGNFTRLSHVFSIDTNDAAVIARLTGLIRSNQEREDYVEQNDPKTGKPGPVRPTCPSCHKQVSALFEGVCLPCLENPVPRLASGEKA